MITKLTLGNFRLFDEPVTVRFRPVTVLIGGNNSGKSSVIKFLLMLQQSLSPLSPDFLNPEGERVKLGEFKSLKNTQSKKDMLTFALELETAKVSRGAELIIDAMGTGKKPEETPPLPEGKIDWDVKARFSISAAVPYLRAKKGEHTVTATSSSGFVLFPLHRKIRRHSSVFMGFTQLAEKAMLEQSGKMIDDFLKKVATATGNADSLPGGILYRPVKEMYTEAYIEGARMEIIGMRHLAPTRQTFSRVMELASPPEGIVGFDGKHAMPHLKKIMDNRGGAQTELVSRYLNLICDIEKIRFSKTDYLSDAYIKVTATNRHTHATHHLPDFGFGVSQALPIIVQGAIAPKGAQFMVEQPEAQLHPTAQLELGSFFADIWKKFGVGSIIETHSDNILLRLRRLVANGTLSKDDVSVAFFEIDKKGKATVKNLDIEADGSMDPGLPMEFFHADIIEGLELGVGK